MAGDTHHRRRRWRTLTAALAVAVGLAVLCAPAASIADDGPLGDLPLNPQWLANTLSRAAGKGR